MKTEDHNATITRFPGRPRILFPERVDFKKMFESVRKGIKHPPGFYDSSGEIYIRNFWGESFDSDLYKTLDEDTAVREFTAEYWNVTSPLHKDLKEETNESHRIRLTALRLVRRAFLEDDETSFQEILDRGMKMLLRNPAKWTSRKRGQEREMVKRIYPMFLSKEIRKARVRMWSRDGEWVPIIFCPNMNVAMYAFAAFDLIETCPNCQKLFCVDTPRVDGSRAEHYCTVACGQRFRQRMYRLRNSKEGKSKKR